MCLRHDGLFHSNKKDPQRCSICKSPYWDKPRLPDEEREQLRKVWGRKGGLKSGAKRDRRTGKFR